MDSPETAKTITNTTTTTTATSTDPVTVQDSPIFSYISNLSPIQPVNVAHAAQGFPGLHSPPLVFRSPYINSSCEASFLKGPQFSQPFSAELSQNDDKCKKITAELNVHEKSTAQLSSKLIPSAEKQWDTDASVQAQPCSSPGRDNEYLAKPEVDCAHFEHSANSNVKQVNGVPQLSEIGHPESMKNIEKANDNEDFKEDEVGASPTSAEQSEENLQGKSTSHIKLVETEGKQNSIVNTSSDSMSEDHAFKELQCAHTLDQNTDGHNEKQRHCAPQLLKRLQMLEACEDCGQDVGVISDGSASQQKCAIRRRCLFEEVHLNTIADSPSSSNPSNISKSPATLSNTENIDFSFDDSFPTSSNMKLVNLHQSVKTVFSPHNAGNSSLTVPKPSGIGLHLNSIVSALPVNCIAVASLNVSEKDCMNIEGLKSASRLNCHLPENIKISAMSSSVTDDVLASSEDGMYLIAASSTSESLYKGKKPLDNSLLKPNESSATAHKKRKFHSDHADSYEHHNQPSPKKKSKKALSTSDGEGCKRCNCKRTKCLKLYCDCFAAGIYCAESCACQGCFNRPEYEDTVLETRQQIESRNPLAFAPKVLKPVSESPADSVEELSRLAPSSARHKRGCNCKKSMCLKKYCECYQANVGCSDGCRCEGCKNVHGRKEDYGLLKESVSQRASIQNVTDTSDEKLKMVATRKGFSCTELYDLHNLTPLTPSFQSSVHGKEAARSQLLSRRYLPSPESDLTVLSSYGKTLRSPRKSDRHDSLCSSSQEMVDIVSYDRELFNCGLERVDPSSPSYDAVINLYNDNPLTDAPSMASASSKTRDWMNGSGVELCPGSGKLSSGGSLRWRSSPITPMTQLGETKILQGFDSDSGLYDILEDGTPDILKESTPVKTVNVNSPKRKRVSPPNKQLHGLGSSSSGGLRSGRKFILQAVPSFPPLTPCTDTKGSTHQNKSDIKKDSRNK